MRWTQENNSPKSITEGLMFYPRLNMTTMPEELKLVKFMSPDFSGDVGV